MYKGTVIWPLGARVHEKPNLWSSTIQTLKVGDKVSGSVLVLDDQDSNNPNKRWMQLLDGGFVAVDYPTGLDVPQKRLDVVKVAEEAAYAGEKIIQMRTKESFELPNSESTKWNIGSFMHHRLQGDPKFGKPHSINLGKLSDPKSWAGYFRKLNPNNVIWNLEVDTAGTRQLLSSSDEGVSINIPAQLLGAGNILNVIFKEGKPFTRVIGLAAFDPKLGFVYGSPPDASVINYQTRPDLVHRIGGCTAKGKQSKIKGDFFYMPVLCPATLSGAGNQKNIWIETSVLKPF